MEKFMSTAVFHHQTKANTYQKSNTQAVKYNHQREEQKMAAERYEILFKFIIVGSSGAGKTCLLHRFTDDKFSEEHTHTIGVEFGSKIIEIARKRIKLQLWDTAGQERYKSVTKSYFRGAAGAVLVYDVTNRESYEQIGQWLEDTRTLAGDDIVCLLVGNKADVAAGGHERRQVSFLEASQFALENGMMFLETSAYSGINVTEIFSTLSKKLMAKIEEGEIKPPPEKSSILAISIPPARSSNSGNGIERGNAAHDAVPNLIPVKRCICI